MPSPSTSDVSGPGPGPKHHLSTHHLPSLPTPFLVTIYPTRALIRRTIPAITIKPGRNEIVLQKLTPYADEDSVKVRFIPGNAGERGGEKGEEEVVVSDMVVDLVRPPLDAEDAEKQKEDGIEKPENENKEAGELDSSPDSSCDDDSDSDAISETETPALTSLTQSITTLTNTRDAAKDTIKSCDMQLSVLEKWGQTLSSSPSATRPVEVIVPFESGGAGPAEVGVGNTTTETVAAYLSVYDQHRKELFSRKLSAQEEERVAQKELEKVVKERAGVMKKMLRRKVRASDEKRRRKEEERERMEEEGKGTGRKGRGGKKEPEKWLRVRVWIEREEGVTGGYVEDRVKGKMGVDADEDPEADDSGNVIQGELELSYIVSQASWTPRYDLTITSYTSTTSNPQTPSRPTATLTYHAHFQNRTLETWKDALITLSTSQTNFAGLADTVPILEPWKVQLTRHYGRIPYQRKSRHGDLAMNVATTIFNSRSKGGLYSSQEKALTEATKEREFEKERRKELSGGSDIGGSSNARRREEKELVLRSSGLGGKEGGRGGVALQEDEALSGEKLMKKKAGLGLNSVPSFAMSSLAPSSQAPMGPSELMHCGMGVGEENDYQAGGARGDGGDSDSEDSGSELLDEISSLTESLTPTLPNTTQAPQTTPAPPKPKFTSQGLTTTYAIPHPLTIPSAPYNSDLKDTSSSASTRRHTIMTIPLPHVTLSYLSVPKLRSAAYLKAKIFNTSQTTLQKGKVGLTLDSTFLGSTALSKIIYPGDLFNLSLGIDESIGVNYARPSMRCSLQKAGGGGWGTITKGISLGGKGNEELVVTFARSTVIRNGRLDRGVVEVVVVDQVPISEDSRFSCHVAFPRGLRAPPLPSAAVGNRKGGLSNRGVVEDPGEVLGTAGQDGELDEQHGATMKLGPAVPTGTGVYIEGFIDDDKPQPLSSAPTTSYPAQTLIHPPTVAHNQEPATSTSASGSILPSFGTTPRSGSKSKISFFGGSKNRSSVSPNTSSTAIAAPHPAAIFTTNPAIATAGAGKTTAATIHAPVAGEQKWGSAVAAMRRNGEVVWKVKLNPGMGVRLGLEYECKLPTGEAMKEA